MVIVDANTWPAVFDPSNQRHGDFRPVKDYIENNFKSLAWGGSHYVNELRNCPKYLKMHLELEKGSRAIRFDDKAIDKDEVRIKQLEDSKDFDDPHIIAIQIISKAPIICSCDKRAFDFFKKPIFYPKLHPRPKIYSKKSNKDLFRKI
jgi:hypothetical protein